MDIKTEAPDNSQALLGALHLRQLPRQEHEGWAPALVPARVQARAQAGLGWTEQ
jgi:hypothetical protein